MALTVAQIDEGINSILKGGQIFKSGDKTYTRANLSELVKLRDIVRIEETAAASAAANPVDSGVYLANFNHSRG